MKRLFTLMVLATFSFFTTTAQLPDGSIAPNFTTTDLNGNTVDLYEILDQGKSVVLDLSATWCGPCWNYHQGGVLENLHLQYGPEGLNEIVVLMVEADPSTDEGCLYGQATCNGTSLGDWTVGVEYPIINDDEIAELYGLTYYPTIYHICPNRVLTESGQLNNVAAFAALGNDCKEAFGQNNAGILNYTGFTGDFCRTETFTPSVQVQNLGTEEMTSATIEFWVDGMMTESKDWTGSLTTYQIVNVEFNEVTINADASFEARVVGVNGSTDEDMTDNMITGTASLSKTIADNFLTLELTTDQYSGETFWALNDENGAAVYTGGNALVVGGASALGAYAPNTSYTFNLPLPKDGCYDFTFYDSFGDGFEAGGSYRLIDQGGNVVSEGSGNFGTQRLELFSLETTNVVTDNGAISFYSGEAPEFCTSYVYSPSVSVQNVGTNEITSVGLEVVNPLGEVILSQDWTGSIAPSSSGFITLDEVTIEDNGNVEIRITSINGAEEAAINSYGNSISAPFTRNYTEETTWELNFALGPFAYEMYWEVLNSAGEVMASGGNETVGSNGGGLRVAAATDPGAYAANSQVTETITIPMDVNDCYTLHIVDDWGDGGQNQQVSTSFTLNTIDADGASEELAVRSLFFSFTDFNTLLDANPFFVSTDELETVNDLVLAPNPTSDQLNVSFSLTEATRLNVVIYNLLGQPVKTLASQNFAAGTQQIETSVADLANGLYYVNMTDGSRQLTKKFTVVNH